MSNVQRWYIYITCAISLQGVTWAIIELLRNLIVFGAKPGAISLQIAVIIIGLPVFLIHWLQARKYVVKSLAERGSPIRRLYLYAMMAAFLEAIIFNIFNLLNRLLQGAAGIQDGVFDKLSVKDALPFHLIAIVILAGVWFYHQLIINEDTRSVPVMEGTATVRRLYVYLFSTAGFVLTITALIRLIRWLMFEIGHTSVVGTGTFLSFLPMLIVGTPLWAIFWNWAQRLFYGPSEEEHSSILRKIYIYGIILVAALDVVINIAGILSRLIYHALVPDAPSSGDIRQPLAIMLGMGLAWAYHAYLLRADTQLAGEAPRQAGVRRIYLYLIAAVGFGALLFGLYGAISTLLRLIEETFTPSLRGQLSLYIAAILAGLPVWVIPWRQAQAEAIAGTKIGSDARQSVVRKIYLYFFLFVATMTILGSAIFIVYRLLNMILGGEALTLTLLGNAISFSLIAAAVGIYHLRILRSDGSFARREKVNLFEQYRLVVVDVGEGHFANELVALLKREIPEISLTPVILQSTPAETEDQVTRQTAILDQLASAGLIVGPWSMAITGGGKSAENLQIAQAVASSPAHKLLVPIEYEGWDWAGMDRYNNQAMLRQTVHAIKQVLDGSAVKAYHPLGAGAIIAIVIAVLIVLSIVGSIITSLL